MRRESSCSPPCNKWWSDVARSATMGDCYRESSPVTWREHHPDRVILCVVRLGIGREARRAASLPKRNADVTVGAGSMSSGCDDAHSARRAFLSASYGFGRVDARSHCSALKLGTVGKLVQGLCVGVEPGMGDAEAAKRSATGLMSSQLNEHQRRRFAASEARTFGYGGIAAAASGWRRTRFVRAC